MAGRHRTRKGEAPVDVGRLAVLYDERCALCRRCADWLLGQPCLLPVELLPAGHPEVRARYPRASSWLGKELVVVDDHDRMWIGPGAYLMAMWATASYRSWAHWLAKPALFPLATRFFLFVSKRRGRIGAWIGKDDPACSYCDQVRVEHGVS